MSASDMVSGESGCDCIGVSPPDPCDRCAGSALDEWAVWALEHLPGTPADYARKARAEWSEFEEARDATEAADVIMCLAAFIAARGISPEAVIRNKFRINRERTWERQPDGTYQHVPATRT